jgi:8-oxo-dGTP diphosphatase
LEFRVTDKYRNPTPTTDAIISDLLGRIILIRRKNPPHGWAIPGGFVNEGESLEQACAREAREETGLVVELVSQLFTYSDPKRDPRQHTVSTVYACRAPDGAQPEGRDDALEARWYAEGEVPWAELCFDHAAILRDYFEWTRTGRRRARWP